jgi:hypothetical protein
LKTGCMKTSYRDNNTYLLKRVDDHGKKSWW